MCGFLWSCVFCSRLWQPPQLPRATMVGDFFPGLTRKPRLAREGWVVESGGRSLVCRAMLGRLATHHNSFSTAGDKGDQVLTHRTKKWKQIYFELRLAHNLLWLQTLMCFPHWAAQHGHDRVTNKFSWIIDRIRLCHIIIDHVKCQTRSFGIEWIRRIGVQNNPPFYSSSLNQSCYLNAVL